MNLNMFLLTIVNGFSVPLLILTVSAFRRDPYKRWLDLTTATGYIVFGMLAINLTEFLSKTITRSCDVTLLQADRMLGFDPIAFANTLSQYWLVMVILILVYIMLPVAMGLAWVLEQDFQLRRSVLFGGCLCFIFTSLLFPAVGPRHFDFVNSVPKVIHPEYNCMPSMHLTWALLIAMNARSRKLKIALWIYATLIAISTLGVREHYLVDLIAAVPYALFIQSVSKIFPNLGRLWVRRYSRDVVAPPLELTS